MAAKKSKTKKAKKAAPRKAASKKPKRVAKDRAAKKVAPTTLAKKPGKAATRSAKKNRTKKSKKLAKKPSPPTRTPAKKVAPKKTTPARSPAAAAARPPALKAFAGKVRDCDVGTPVWFTVAGGIEHAAIQRRGSDGTIVVLTDAGATEVVASSNLFETADQARAARTR